jgi:hypothetical protein
MKSLIVPGVGAAMRRPTLMLVCITFMAAGCGKKAGPSPAFFRPAPGTFEFCIAANPTDDDLAIEVATEWFAKAKTDPARRNELAALAERGATPPDPVLNDPTFLPRGVEGTYRWVPLSKHFLRSEGLDPLSTEPHSPGMTLYRNLAECRGGTPFVEPSPFGRVYWSRERPGMAGEPATVDYFMLVRVEAEADAIRAEEIEIYRVPAQAIDDSLGLGISLDETGGAKLARVTTRNAAETVGGVERSRFAAIVIRGSVVTAARLHEPIVGRGMILAGGFDEAAIQSLLAGLRGE